MHPTRGVLQSAKSFKQAKTSFFRHSIHGGAGLSSLARQFSQAAKALFQRQTVLPARLLSYF
jgi:hypothetical protein